MSDVELRLPPAMALRESFGDRKPPDISRRITACVACRKQKIKCNMNDSRPPCARCKKRGLSCTVNRSLQMLLEGDVSWKHEMESKINSLEDAIKNITGNGSLLAHVSPGGARTSHDFEGPDLAFSSPTMTVNSSRRAWEVVMDPDRGPAAIPASCVSEVSTNPSPNLGLHGGTDLVSRGLISFAKAEALFAIYHTRLDHFLYRILADHDSLDSIRASSPLLTAAVCTVGALHTSSLDYRVCYQEFIHLSSGQMFSKEGTFDDVRALVIGAFWLSDISWTLVGAAVRTSAEVHLHRCIAKIPHDKRECYLRTRLFFLVYVCDHHFSVAYGRPPMTREFCNINSPIKFLECEYATEDDARLVRQLEIWSISSRAFDSFWVDTERPVPTELLPQLRRLSIALDTWRADWNERFGVNSKVGNYPRKGVGLHYHFAKLYLHAHAFRGASKSGNTSSNMSHDLEELANAAILSAFSILRVIVSNSEVQSYLNGLPTYFDTMIAFATVFLLKVAMNHSAQVRIDRGEVFNVIEKLVTVLKRITEDMCEEHLLSSIANSIEKVLETCRQSAEYQSASHPSSEVPAMFDLRTSGQNLVMTPAEPVFLGETDFLWPSDMDFNLDIFDFWHIPQHDKTN